MKRNKNNRERRQRELREKNSKKTDFWSDQSVEITKYFRGTKSVKANPERGLRWTSISAMRGKCVLRGKKERVVFQTSEKKSKHTRSC